MNLYFEHSPFLIILAVIVAAGLSFFLYYKDKTFSELQKWKRVLMSALRFLFIFIILVLLLKPVFKSSSTIIQKPIIVLAQDNSRSVVFNKDSSFYKNEYKTEINRLIENLKSDYDVHYLQFSEFTTNDSIMDFSGELTDISSVFPEVISRYSGMNLGAVVLATDGIYNRGINPVYARNINVPVYSIALGDTVSQKDLILKDLMHNRIAFYGNSFPLRIFIGAEKTVEKESEIIISRNGKVVYSSKFELPENSTVKTIETELPADQLGIQQYEILLKPLTDEISYDNNRATFIINVIDNRNKILLLANSPHPDIGAIQFALKDNPDFELNIQYINEFKANIKDFDLVILHQLPSVQNVASNVMIDIEKNAVPVLYILGTSSSLDVFNNLNTGFEIKSISNKTDDAVPSYNQNFSSFSLDVEPTFFNQLSPLKVFFGDYKYTGDTKTLIFQTVNGIKTEKPLIAFNENKNVKNGFILGDGIWKWRIDDYRYNSEHKGFNSLVNRIIQYLIVKKIQDKLSIEAKQIFSENEPVIINSEFYNEAFETVSDLNIELILKDEEGKEFKYTFGSFGSGYRLNLGRLANGKYQYTASTMFDNKEYTATGEFIVQKINIESLITTANHGILYNLAENTGGKVFYPENISGIKESLKENSNVVNVAYTKDKLYTITDLYFLFFIILLFAATEWGLRKYFGGY
ncbi:MAG: hypothetical protein LBQ22_09765 [Bacteroidales bacterium]|nr:hypothetical protein [Bacteroidales bacterium]